MKNKIFVSLILVALLLLAGCSKDEPIKDPTPPVISDVKIINNGDDFVTVGFALSNPDGVVLEEVGVLYGDLTTEVNNPVVGLTNVTDVNKTIEVKVSQLNDDTSYNFIPYVKYRDTEVQSPGPIFGNTITKKLTLLSEFPGEARTGAVSFAIGDKVYVGLGSKTFGVHTNDDNFADFWSYNTTLDEWTKMSDFPGGARSLAFAFTLDGKGFVGGGRDSNTEFLNSAKPDLWEFDPSSNSWVQKNDLPWPSQATVPLGFLFPIVAAGPSLAYYGSGFFGITGMSFAGFMYRYDFVNDSWTEVPPVPLPYGGCSSFVIGNRIFFGACPGYEWTSRFFRLNFLEDQWMEQTSIPGIANIRESEFGGKGFAIGDFGYIIEPFGKAFKYDVVNNKWEQIVKYSPLVKGIIATYGVVGAVANGKVYLGLGYEQLPGSTSSPEYKISKRWAVFDSSK